MANPLEHGVLQRTRSSGGYDKSINLRCSVLAITSQI